MSASISVTIPLDFAVTLLTNSTVEQTIKNLHFPSGNTHHAIYTTALATIDALKALPYEITPKVRFGTPPTPSAESEGSAKSFGCKDDYEYNPAHSKLDQKKCIFSLRDLIDSSNEPFAHSKAALKERVKKQANEELKEMIQKYQTPGNLAAAAEFEEAFRKCQARNQYHSPVPEARLPATAENDDWTDHGWDSKYQGGSEIHGDDEARSVVSDWIAKPAASVSESEDNGDWPLDMPKYDNKKPRKIEVKFYDLMNKETIIKVSATKPFSELAARFVKRYGGSVKDFSFDTPYGTIYHGHPMFSDPLIWLDIDDGAVIAVLPHDKTSLTIHFRNDSGTKEELEEFDVYANPTTRFRELVRRVQDQSDMKWVDFKDHYLVFPPNGNPSFSVTDGEMNKTLSQLGMASGTYFSHHPKEVERESIIQVTIRDAMGRETIVYTKKSLTVADIDKEFCSAAGFQRGTMAYFIKDYPIAMEEGEKLRWYGINRGDIINVRPKTKDTIISSRELYD